MPAGPDGKTIIIVKKVSGHGGHHGGSWKVAYADFVTSMMALFMVLWLVNSASTTTRERIASYFKRPGVFELGSGTPLEQGNQGILDDAFAPPETGNTQIRPDKRIYTVDTKGGPKKEGYEGGKPSEVGTSEGEKAEKKVLEKIASELKNTVNEETLAGVLAGILGTVEIKVDQRGLHLEIMDTATASMFEKGSPRILPQAETELRKIAEAIAKVPNPIDIEGHTDATPFHPSTSEFYDNWNLSSDRANEARRVLQGAGVKEWQIARVVGYAAQRLKIPDNPLAPSNRRISISMRYTDLAAEALKSSQMSQTSSKPIVPRNPDGSWKSSPSNSNPNPTPTPATGEINFGDLTELGADRIIQESSPAENKGETKRLSIEIGTSLPEGPVVEQQQREGQVSKKPWMEKDKIFGDRDPFFGR